MIRVIDILNRTDRNKCGKSKDFVSQNGLLGINVAGGGCLSVQCSVPGLDVFNSISL